VNKILILGATGYLGSRFFDDLEDSFGTCLREVAFNESRLIHFDACAPHRLEEILEKFKPSAVINCIGFSNVDACEMLPERNWLINCWAPYKMAQICKSFSVKFVHISTDHFAKLGDGRISESDNITFVNQYGFAKYCAENAIMTENNKSLVIRTNFFHFNFGNPYTYLDRLVNSSKNREDTSRFEDVFFTPVSTSYLIRMMLKLISLDCAGIVNVASEYPISKYDFHNLVLNRTGYEAVQHKAVSMMNAGLKAKRPLFMALNSEKLKVITGTRIPALEDMIREEIILARSSKESKIANR
jgi:dTDP-4-dehydrorhamnose reductase